jgi:hypothetical protein
MRNIGLAEGIQAGNYTSTQNGSAIDLAANVAGQHTPFKYAGPGGREFKAIMSANWTSGTADVKIQHSADGSTDWTDITGATFTQVTADAVEEIHFVAPRRWIRVVATLATTPDVDLCVMILGEERYD